MAERGRTHALPATPAATGYCRFAVQRGNEIIDRFNKANRQ